MTEATKATDPMAIAQMPEMAVGQPAETATSPHRKKNKPKPKARTRIDEWSIPRLVAAARASSQGPESTPVGRDQLVAWPAGIDVWHDNDRRPVGDDFGHRVADFGRVEPHREDRVPAHERRVLDHSVEGLAPGVLEQRGVLMDFATNDRSQAGGEVSGEATASDDEAEDLPLDLCDAVSGHVRGRSYDHWISFVGWVNSVARCLSASQVSHEQPRRSASKV